MRKPLGPKERWEILQRDQFTCQYCGAKGQDAVLHIDHVISVADGGDNRRANLKTACEQCNAGKGSASLYSFRNALFSHLRGDRDEAVEQLLIVCGQKFRGVDREWLKDLLHSSNFETAVYCIEDTDDFRGLIEGLVAGRALDNMLDLGWMPEEDAAQIRKRRKLVVDRVWRLWDPRHMFAAQEAPEAN